MKQEFGQEEGQRQNDIKHIRKRLREAEIETEKKKDGEDEKKRQTEKPEEKVTKQGGEERGTKDGPAVTGPGRRGKAEDYLSPLPTPGPPPQPSVEELLRNGRREEGAEIGKVAR